MSDIKHVLTGQITPATTTPGSWVTIVLSIILIQVTRVNLWPGWIAHPWVMDNNCVKYYPYPTWQYGHGFRICVHCDLELRDIMCSNFKDSWSRKGLSVYVHCGLDL